MIHSKAAAVTVLLVGLGSQLGLGVARAGDDRGEGKDDGERRARAAEPPPKSKRQRASAKEQADPRSQPSEATSSLPALDSRQRLRDKRPSEREFSEQYQKRKHAREATRLERRNMRRVWLRQAWGQLVLRQPFITEFKLHAWRMARLRRVQELAQELAKPELLARVAKLIDKEEARHQKQLAKLKASASEETPPKQAPARAGAPSAESAAPAPSGAPGRKE